MNAKRNILAISCAVAMFGAANAFAETISVSLPDNKNTTFAIEFVSNVGNTWTYKISYVAGRDLSHWMLVLPNCKDKYVSYTEGAEIGKNPAVAGDPVGIKWNTKGGTFSFTLDQAYAAVPVQAIAKSSTNHGAGSITGPSCVETPPPCEDKVYAVHDQGLNDSQFFSIDPASGFAVEALGAMYPAYDIEALDIHPTTKVLYAGSGDNSEQQGHLYIVDKDTGALTDLGSTGVREIDGLSFRNDGTLWGWAQDSGLFVIADPATSVAAEIIVPSSEVEVGDLAWSLDGSTLYAAQVPKDEGEDPDERMDSGPMTLWKYVPATGQISTICEALTHQLGEIEGLETLPDDTLAVSVHGNSGLMLGVINPATCELVVSQTVETNYDDVEGIAWPACAAVPE
ncbi:hypothetical protein [Thioflexithrix psekupsensis]|uniref:SMP-30/Gluconolactonase/LRE-like region domain-containing protein n=1 Tax=Thioflexithrix psekupsensis TaxID=1570016 RepID=A0A251XB85_9GAMM|nr:hypothetical protein [Thioflexithrix psekupsensis]OUD15336.1 hypothetical protein TPSD3_02060 [Thioflexithrix psekupsensis]